MPRPVGFTAEDEGAKKKWDAWARERGVSKTEAKRRYITYLIETMKIYASGTLEARELLAELEYVWDQIKDVQFTLDDEGDDEKFPISLQSPLFGGNSDRMSTGTPSVAANQLYRNNLQKIYSHSRRNTMSVNDYVQQQRQNAQGSGYGRGAPSVYSLPTGRGRVPAPPANLELEELKAWQGEVNTLITKLTREIVTNGRPSGLEASHEEEEEWREVVKRRAMHLLRLLGRNAAQFLRNFSVSLLAILFIVWLLKKNVVVKQTMVKGDRKKELVINMVLDTNENKWFLRMLRFVNGFVGFV